MIIPLKIPIVRDEMQELVDSIEAGVVWDLDDIADMLRDWMPRMVRASRKRKASGAKRSRKLSAAQKIQIDYLRAQGMSQQDVANLLNKNPGCISEYEHGLR